MKLIKKITIVTIILIITIILIFNFFIKDKPVQFFDISNNSNIYTITSNENYFYIKPIDKNIEVIIASSPQDLNNFIDKEVNITGKFIFTTFNKVICPKDNCVRSNKGLQAVEISSISLTK